MRLKQILLFVLILAGLAVSFLHVSFAKEDREDHGERHRYRERHRDDHSSRYLEPVTDLSYKENCGACHLAYQPELLPSASWENIVNHSNEHFGESFELDVETKNAILSYLQTNAAEHSSAKQAVKIVRSLGGQVPIRITDIPYIKEKHHDISAETIKRPSIGSLSNCTACHQRVEEGIYDDDFVVVPK